MDKKAIKKLISALFALALFFAASIPAFADEGTPMGNFSQENGSSPRGDTSANKNDGTTDEIILSDGSVYSTDSGLFCHELEGKRFGVSVPDGAIVTGAVWVSLDPTLTAELYRDGTLLEGVDLSCITYPGKYVLALSSDECAQGARVKFTILCTPTSEIEEYLLPSGFYVISATRNGEQAHATQTWVDLSEDGDYEIRYRCPEANRNMLLSVTVDHTPPTAVLSGVSDGKANGSVELNEVEEDADIILLRNGKQIPYTGTISETGAYVLTLRDRAGNERVYDFVLVSDADIDWRAVPGTIALLLLSLLGFRSYGRKYIRSRSEAIVED